MERSPIALTSRSYPPNKQLRRVIPSSSIKRLRSRSTTPRYRIYREQVSGWNQKQTPLYNNKNQSQQQNDPMLLTQTNNMPPPYIVNTTYTTLTDAQKWSPPPQKCLKSVPEVKQGYPQKPYDRPQKLTQLEVFHTTHNLKRQEHSAPIFANEVQELPPLTGR